METIRFLVIGITKPDTSREQWLTSTVARTLAKTSDVTICSDIEPEWKSLDGIKFHRMRDVKPADYDSVIYIYAGKKFRNPVRELFFRHPGIVVAMPSARLRAELFVILSKKIIFGRRYTGAERTKGFETDSNLIFSSTGVITTSAISSLLKLNNARLPVLAMRLEPSRGFLNKNKPLNSKAIIKFAETAAYYALFSRLKKKFSKIPTNACGNHHYLEKTTAGIADEIFY